MSGLRVGQKVLITGTGHSGSGISDMSQMVGGIFEIESFMKGGNEWPVIKNYVWDKRDLQIVAPIEDPEPEKSEPVFFNTENLIQ